MIAGSASVQMLIAKPLVWGEFGVFVAFPHCYRHPKMIDIIYKFQTRERTRYGLHLLLIAVHATSAIRSRFVHTIARA
jgi:hypothetical protein